MKQLTCTPALSIVNGQPVASSLDVARHFGKSHSQVLRDIRRAASQAPETAGLDFMFSTRGNARGRRQTVCHLGQDGFAAVVAGYTGQNAARLKAAYLERYRELEGAPAGNGAPGLPAHAQREPQAPGRADDLGEPAGIRPAIRTTIRAGRRRALPHRPPARPDFRQTGLPKPCGPQTTAERGFVSSKPSGRPAPDAEAQALAADPAIDRPDALFLRDVYVKVRELQSEWAETSQAFALARELMHELDRLTWPVSRLAQERITGQPFGAPKDYALDQLVEALSGGGEAERALNLAQDRVRRQFNLALNLLNALNGGSLHCGSDQPIWFL